MKLFVKSTQYDGKEILLNEVGGVMEGPGTEGIGPGNNRDIFCFFLGPRPLALNPYRKLLCQT